MERLTSISDKSGEKNYSIWEEGIANVLSDKLDISYGDAQGIIEANEFYMAQSWAKGLDATQAANVIIDKSNMAKGGKLVKRNGREYPTGSAWKVEHNNRNKAEKWEQYAKGGIVKYYNDEGDAYRLSRPSGSIEKELLDRVQYYANNSRMFVGNFGWQTPQKELADGFLYKLDDFDIKFVKDVKLKSGEKIFRYLNRNTAISGSVPLIKINTEKGLLYWNQYSDDDTINFESKGTKAVWISLIENRMAEGGNIDKWSASDGEILKNDELIDNYEFDYDSDAFWVSDRNNPSGSVSFDTKDEMIQYFKNNPEKKEMVVDYGVDDNGDAIIPYKIYKDGKPLSDDEINDGFKKHTYADGGRMEAGGDDATNNEVVTFFNNVDYSKLPPAFSSYIKKEILTDEDLQYLSPREPIFLEIKSKIESYNASSKNDDAPSEEKQKIIKEIADLEGLKDLVSGDELTKINKELDDLNGLLPIL